MPLPSQTARTSTAGRTPMFRRKRQNSLPLMIGGVALIGIVFGAWMIWGGKGGSEQENLPLTSTVGTQPPSLSRAAGCPGACARLHRARCVAS